MAWTPNETGWKTYNNDFAEIVYGTMDGSDVDTAWYHGSNTEAYNKDVSVSSGVNRYQAIVKFSFTGTKFRIRQIINSSAGEYAIYIDDVKVKNVARSTEIAYSTTTLSDTTHVCKIYFDIIPTYTRSIYVDSIDVNETDNIIPYFEPKTKYLIQNDSSNVFKIDNGSVVDLGVVSVDESLFTSQGVNTMPSLTEENLTQIGSCKILKWTDSGEAEHTLNLQGDYKDQLFKLMDGWKLLTWTDNASATSCGMTCGIDPISLMDNLVDYKLKMWTDDVNVISPLLKYEAKTSYKPIDILDNNFKVLMYKEE